jgi:energy-coupling factor transporter ATP-binding protein EcfA2
MNNPMNNSNNKHIIVLIGKIGSGKSTVADILKKQQYNELYFAEPLKQFGISIGFTHDQIYGTQAQKNIKNDYYGVSGREFMQKVGTELFRNKLDQVIDMNLKGSSIWVKNIERQLSLYDKIVISDCRFPDELSMLKKYNSIVIKLVRNYNDDASHISEQHIDEMNADYTIDNNGSIDDLNKTINNIINNM